MFHVVYSRDRILAKQLRFLQNLDVDWNRALQRFKRFCTKHKFYISYVVLVGVKFCEFRVGSFQAV